MSTKRKITFSLSILFLLAVLFFGLVAGIYLFLPHYLESRLLPLLVAETGISDVAFEVRRVGFFGADLGEVRIGPQPNPALLIRSVQLDYSPGELYRKKIGRVVLSGIEVNGRLENGKFALTEFDLQKVLSNLQSRQKAQPTSGQISPPVLANRLEIRNAALIIKIKDQLYRVPFEIEITPDNSEYTLFEVAALLYPRGQKISCEGKIDLTRHRIRLKTEIFALNLGRFSDIVRLAGDFSASGKVNMTATADLQFAPFQISSLNAALELQAYQFKMNNSQFQTIDSMSLNSTLAGRYDHDGNWQLTVNSQDGPKSPAKTARFRFNQYEVTSKIPLIDVSGRAGKDRMTAAYTILLADVRMNSGSETIQVPKAVLKGTADFSGEDKAFSTGEFELQAPGTSLASAAGKITINEISLAGKINNSIRDAMSFNGLLRFGGGRLSPADMDGHIGKVSGEIPFVWPPERHRKKGRVSIASLNYRHLNLGRIQCEIQQTESGFDVDGRHISELLPHTSLKFVGSSRIFNTRRPTADIRLNLSRPVGAADIDLSGFHPAAKGIKVNGKFILSGKFFMEDAQFFTSIESQLINGRVVAAESKFAIDGIQMSLAMPELPEVRSAPGQQLRFSKLSLGELTAENGIIDFQIESLRSFLIEKAHFEWSGGKVDTQAMRISQGIDDYHIIFYCDRLNLARVLGQFGAAAAEGSGTVSGRIPIRYAKGELSFDDGFLFSTPGAGGKIHLTGTEVLTAGIPPETPQFAQMDLAREALKDYDYSWAKLSLTSEKEDLLLQMQMDGKPARTLPFVYKKDIGGFIRVEADSEGSHFQGIRLDVNFRLPLNKLLQYKDLIKMIQ
ncbi:MAG: YdbH domain-containing protein [Desulfobacterales bacterium]